MKAQEKNLNAAGAVNVEESSDPENGGQNAYLTVYVKGQFEKPDRQALIDRINEIRREACAEGVANPADGEPGSRKPRGTLHRADQSGKPLCGSRRPAHRRRRRCLCRRVRGVFRSCCGPRIRRTGGGAGSCLVRKNDVGSAHDDRRDPGCFSADTAHSVTRYDAKKTGSAGLSMKAGQYRAALCTE